jgi:hypothetical protein
MIIYLHFESIISKGMFKKCKNDDKKCRGFEKALEK